MVRATSVGSGSVRDRVIVVKLASRSLTTTVRASGARRAQAARGPPGQPEQLAADHLGVVDVAGERLLGADALLRTAADHRALVPAPGQRGQVGTGRGAELALQGGRPGSRAMSRTVRSPSRASTWPVCSPHPPQRGHRQRVQEVEDAVGRARPAARPACTGSTRAWPRTWHEATPTEQVMPCCSAIVARISCADPGGRPEPPDGPGHVEERLVEGERLHLRGDRPEDLHDLPGDGRVAARAGAR